jgi:aminomethyltransferase
MVPVGCTPLGTTLRVTTLDDTRDAVVVEKPFVDPRKQTPKG